MKRPPPAWIVTAFLLGAAARGAAAMPAAPSDAAASFLEAADGYARDHQWQKAADIYDAITRREPGNGAAWLGLGRARLNLHDDPAAIAAFEKAVDLGTTPPAPQMSLARAHARRGERDKAFAWLDKALAAGFTSVQTLETDPDLVGLKTDSRFAKFVEKVERRAHPCQYDEANRRFDFWVGDWDVTTPQGQAAGSNSIQKLLDGCLLLENWTSASGGSGKSLNYLDPGTRTWRQVWVDSGGDVITYAGEFRGGAMRFQGEHLDRNGRKVLSRMSFTPLPDGHVRQFIEESEDGGKTWSVWFDGNYAPRK